MMDSSDSGFTSNNSITDSSISSMRSDRIDESSDCSGDEDSDYSLADSYDEEVADCHEYENDLKAQAEKEKATFSLATMIKQ